MYSEGSGMVSWFIWATVFLTGLAFEARTIIDKRKGDTLTEKTRALFFVHTKLGRVIFAVTWIGFSTWFLGHILQWWP